MDYKRFGRLNSKKIEELKKDSKLYDMGKFFPYLPTRSKGMDQRHTISSFKTMIKKYRYAYSLYDNCKALIKRKGIEYETECIEIDNNVYVFTDIAPYDIEYDHSDFEILYDRDELIPVQNDRGSTFNDMTTSTLQNMQDRKLSPTQYKQLIDYLTPINFISLKNEYAKINELDEAVFNEFVWRMVLFGKGIYKESEIKEVYIKKKRSRVEDDHTLFYGYDRYGSLEYLHSFAKELEEAMHYNQTVTANKLFYEFLERNDNTFLLDEFTGNQLLLDALSIYKEKIAYLLSLKENYAFLTNPYSKEYRQFFTKRKEAYLLFKTQQIMRKLKSEYHTIDDIVNSLREEQDKTETSMNAIQKAIKNYKKDLGDNQLPNQGFGFSGDGWDGGSDEDDLWHQIRDETEWKTKQEAMEREHAESEAEYWANYDPEEEARLEEEQIELEIQRLVNKNKPLELFEFNENAYFEHYESISIKEALKIKQLVVIDDVLLEGDFFSLQEMDDWLGKRLFHFSFVEFDK